MEGVPPPNWWIDEYVRVASSIEGGPATLPEGKD